MNLHLPRFRFSIRSLLCITLLWSLVTGLYFASLRNETRIERLARTEISKLGGASHTVNYKPEWLKTLLSDQDLSSITVVRLDGAEIKSGDLAALSELPQLGGLHLCDAKVSDSAIADINGLRHLRQLDLSRTEIRNVRLNSLPLLQDLNLTGNQIEQIVLSDLPTLQSLNLGFSTANDEDLKGLVTIPSLESLDLRNTKVTDNGLAHLCGLPNLKTVYVYSTAVTREGTSLLQRTLPNCNVIGAR
jgi:Leucine-rich repeat (LRR) protein